MLRNRLPNPISLTLICFAAALALFHGRHTIEQFLLRDTSLYEHLRIGKWIWELRQIPKVDVFSWSRQGQHWVPDGWLSDGIFVAAISCLQRLWFQLEASVILFQAMLVALSAALFLIVCTQRFTLKIAPIAAVFAFCFLTKNAWTFTPGHLHSLALFPLALAFTLQFKPKNLIWQILLTMLWVNLSLDFVLLPFLLFVIALGTFFDGKREKAKLSLKNLCCVLIASGINPHGYSYLFIPWKLITEGAAFKQYFQWQSLNFHNSTGIPFAIAGVSLAIYGLKKPLSYQWTMLWLSSVVMVLLTPRFQIFFACVASLLTARFIEEKQDAIRAVVPRSNFVNGILQFLSVVGALGFFFAQILLLHQDTIKLPFSSLLQTVDRLVFESQENKQRLRLFNDLSLAGILISHDIKVFIDHHQAFYAQTLPNISVTKSVFDDYHELIELRPNWKKVLDHWKFNVAVLRFDSSLISILTEREHWKLVWRSEDFIREINGKPVALGVAVLVGPS